MTVERVDPDADLSDVELSDVELNDVELNDAELTALALAADPDAPIAKGAVPIGIHLAQMGSSLPLWYMPPVARQGGGSRWKAPVVMVVVSAFLLIDLMGLCNTYGILSLA